MPHGTERAAARRQLAKGHVERIFVGRESDGAVVRLSDAEGRQRLRIRVDNEGTTLVEFLDADGSVVRTLTGDGSKD